MVEGAGEVPGASLAGRLLLAAPVVADPVFARSVVLLLAHDIDGALGVILNRPSGAAVDESVPSWSERAVEPRVLFAGGPVEQRAVFALEASDDPFAPTALAGVGLASPDDTIGPPLRVFAGYAGWGPGQLEDELAEDAWVVSGAESGDVFTSSPSRLWSDVLRRLGGGYRLLASYPPDPSFN